MSGPHRGSVRWPGGADGPYDPSTKGVDPDLTRQVERLRRCRACGHDLITQHDPEDERENL